MDKKLIEEVASQSMVSYEITESSTTGTTTLAFNHITCGPYFDQSTGENRPIAFARAVVRDLFKYNGNQPIADLAGYRGIDPVTKQANDQITFVFNTPGGVLPTGWLPKKSKNGKPVEIVALEGVLPGLGGADPIAVKYFNSSVNEGLTVAPDDQRLPVGLQFTYDDERGIEAKFLKSSPTTGKKNWAVMSMDSTETCVGLVEDLLAVFSKYGF